MGKYPITQAQWQVVANLPKVKTELNPNPSLFKGSNRLVETVNWYEAVEFCARLSQWTGKAYQLPSEAQWEYACRAGTTTPFYFGETITGELANYNATHTYAGEPKGEYRQQTTPIGQFPPNAFGLYDMHGNVWEWCEDNWHSNYEGAPRDGRAWLDKNDNRSQCRVLRGGSWDYYPRRCRSASRNYSEPVNRFDDLGFRVVAVART
jgi:formylglycine-generating enzyme required for sulfatase activity